MKKICICVLVLLAIYPKTFALGWDLGPWDGYMSNIAIGSVGDFMNARGSAPREISPGEARPVITSSTFYLDSSLKQILAEIRVANPFSHDIDVVLVGPSGKEHSIELNWRERGLMGHMVGRIDVDPLPLGAWRVECRGASENEAQMTYRIIGVSRGLHAEDDRTPRASTTRPYGGAISSHINVRGVRDVHNIANGKELLVFVITREGDYILTNLNVTVNVWFSDGSRDSITMSNTGDGFYSGILTLRPNLEGGVVLMANVSNPDGTATPRIDSRWLGSHSWQLSNREPITEPFQRLARTAFDVIGYLPTKPMPLPRYDTTGQ